MTANDAQMPARRVEVVDQGRSGSVTYHENAHRVAFWWEFGLEPTLVFLDGPRRDLWAAEHPWAAGRQAEIFDFVAREVVRQRASGHGYDVDLDTGTIRILRVGGRRGGQSPRERPPVDLEALAMRAPAFLEGPAEPAIPRARSAWERFTDSIAVATSGASRDADYDLEALAELRADERRDAVALLVRRGDLDARACAALGVLASLGTDEALAPLREGMRHYRFAAARLISGKALRECGAIPEDEFEQLVRRQIRAIHDPRDGLALALTLARSRPTPPMRQALLYGSYHGTPCAPAFARLLLELSAAPTPEGDADTERMLEALGPHNSSFTRQAAFAALCARVGLERDLDAD